MKTPRRTAISLFASAGVGDAGLKAAGLDVLVANEQNPYRCAVYQNNHPETEVISGDIWQESDQIVAAAKDRIDGDELFLLFATPPCQGMSTNGAGRLRWEIQQGNRSADDDRNRLIIPAIEVAKQLRPRWLLLENVPNMQNTVIRGPDNRPINIIDYIDTALGDDYLGYTQVVACEHYGIPQTRKRLITIFSRERFAIKILRAGAFFVPEMQNSKNTLRDAIGHLPKLDGIKGLNDRSDFHEHHWVHPLSEEKYWWINNTPEGDTAFNNQCVNPECGFQGNPRHRDIASSDRVKEGDSSLKCLKCGSRLPRPSVRQSDGSLRPLRGFHSAYRRMKYDEPARALTQNFIYEASDNKVHPEQNRVLSILEAMIIQSIDRYSYTFSDAEGNLSRARIAEIIGESVPPYLIEIIVRRMLDLSFEDTESEPTSCGKPPLELQRQKISY